MTEDLVQFNTELPRDLVEEIKLLADVQGKKLRRLVQGIFEDALGRQGAKRSPPKKRTIPEKKRPARRRPRLDPPEVLNSEVQP